MSDKFKAHNSIFSRLRQILKAIRIVLSGNYFLIQMYRDDQQRIGARMTSQGMPYFAQVLHLQAFIKNEFATTFNQFQYKITADDFIDYMPEVKLVGDNSVKLSMAIYESELGVMRLHNVTYLKLKKAEKIYKKEVLKNVLVFFK